MKTWRQRLILPFFLLLAACGTGPQELFETAELEMVQRNYPHAEQLYREIIDKHPNSEFAARARARLQELPQGAPSGAPPAESH